MQLKTDFLTKMGFIDDLINGTTAKKLDTGIGRSLDSMSNQLVKPKPTGIGVSERAVTTPDRFGIQQVQPTGIGVERPKIRMPSSKDLLETKKPEGIRESFQSIQKDSPLRKNTFFGEEGMFSSFSDRFAKTRGVQVDTDPFTRSDAEGFGEDSPLRKNLFTGEEGIFSPSGKVQKEDTKSIYRNLLTETTGQVGKDLYADFTNPFALGRDIKKGAKSFGGDILKTAVTIPRMVTEITGLDEEGYGKSIHDFSVDFINKATKTQQKYGEEAETRFGVPLGSGLGSIALGGSVGLLTKSTLGAAAAMGGIEAKDAYNEAVEAGESPAKGAGLFILSAIGNTALEKLPLDGIISGKGFTSIAKGVLTEGSQEGTQQVFQNAVAKYGYDDTRNLYEGIVEALVVGGIMGGAVSSVVAATDVKIPSEITKNATNKIKETFNVSQEKATEVLNTILPGVKESISEYSAKTREFVEENKVAPGFIGETKVTSQKPFGKKPSPKDIVESRVEQKPISKVIDDAKFNFANERIPKIKKTLYRGEADGIGTGGRDFGEGLYFSKNKKIAKQYGDIREISSDMIPKNPLVFDSSTRFEGFLGTIKKRLGIRHVEAEIGDPGLLVRATGDYDGVIVGDGEIIVKYADGADKLDLSKYDVQDTQRVLPKDPEFARGRDIEQGDVTEAAKVKLQEEGLAKKKAPEAQEPYVKPEKEIPSFGKKKDTETISKSREKINLDLPEEARVSEKITIKKNKETAKKAVKLLKKDKDKALDIVMGKTDEGDLTRTTLASVMMKQAEKEGNTNLLKKLYTATAEHITETAQNLQAVKSLHKARPEYQFVKELLDSRLKKFKMDTPEGKKEIITKKIESVKKEIKKVKVRKFKEANDFLNSIIC